MGLLTVRREGDKSTIDINVVTPDYRRGWCNVWMMYRLAELMREENLRTVVFEADEKLHPATVRYARRCEAIEIGSRLLFGIELL